MTDTETLNAAIREDAGVWFDFHAKIWQKDRSQGLLAPTQNFLQRKIQDTVNRFVELKLPIRIIGLKPRQKGSTTYFAALDYHWMRQKPAYTCIIGGQYSQTNELWDMISTYQKNDTFKWGNTGEITDSFGLWSNGSQLKAETANDKLAGISGTYQILHATEVARWAEYGVSDAATVLTNILKCVPDLPNTIVVLESTAEGQTGTYYDRFIKAIDAEDFISGKKTIMAGDYVRVFAPWFEFDDSAIRLTDQQKKEIERTLDADAEYDGERKLIELYGNKREDGTQFLGTSVTEFDVWEQLAWRRYAIEKQCKRDKAIFDRDYPHSWQDAFMKSGEMRFNRTGVAALRKNMGRRVAQYGVIEEGNGRMSFRPAERTEAKVILMEMPKVGRRYILPIDPMTGITQANGEDPDYHGVNILREGFWDSTGVWNRPAQVAKLIPNRWDIDVVEEAAWRLARFYGDSSGCKIVIEMNQDRGITELLKQRGADLYMREVFNTTEQRTTKAYGYLTMPKTRENLVECLATAIREYDAPDNGIDIWDEYTIEQAENFVRKANGRSEAAQGFKDDELFSIMLGLLLITHATTYSPNRGGLGLPPDLVGLMVPQGGQVSPFS